MECYLVSQLWQNRKRAIDFPEKMFYKIIVIVINAIVNNCIYKIKYKSSRKGDRKEEERKEEKLGLIEIAMNHV